MDYAAFFFFAKIRFFMFTTCKKLDFSVSFPLFAIQILKMRYRKKLT